MVEHNADWAADARRRDFTVNAIYLDEAGQIFDPLSGIDDLRAGCLRFAGDAARRVQGGCFAHVAVLSISIAV